MKKAFLTLVLLIFSQTAGAASLICDAVESLGPVDANGNYQKQEVFKLTAPVQDKDTAPQITAKSHDIKNLQIEVFGCPSCARRDHKAVEELSVSIKNLATGQESFALANSDSVLTELTVGKDAVAVDCVLLP